MGLLQAPRLQITSAFDAGNIEVVDSTDPSNVQLKIRPDPYCESDAQAHYQWFHFQVSTAAGTPLTMHIVNAGSASYASAWQGYRAAASYDMQHWFRVDTSYDEAAGVLTIQHTPTYPCVRYAYFAPYSWERHTDLVMRMQHQPHVQLHLLGQTLDGRDLHMLQVGSPGPDKAVIWVIARQHPGESMAEWFAEGLLQRLTAEGAAAGGDADVAQLLDTAVLFVVPNMCPDGSVRGHLRTNAVGSNLNREWAAPSAERSPEVLAVSQAIAATGLDFLLDVHGDEEIAANFIGSMFGVPAWGPRLERMQTAFTDALLNASPDFQTRLGYALPAPGAANLSTASKANAQKYNTLSLVLEQPFKDTTDTPNAETGWSPERAKAFGASHVSAFLNTVPTLLKERGTRDEQQ
ncbi:peptidase M14, carboxypeptidase A [Scenedesmus sp. NREL 46B-D3]|nr:peptidase M14, carboxypeptidase A [Scenedesmus sp. NREL 46B-D3]